MKLEWITQSCPIPKRMFLEKLTSQNWYQSFPQKTARFCQCRNVTKISKITISILWEVSAMLKLLSANRIRLQKSKFFWIGLFATIGYSVFLLLMNYIEKISYIGNSIVQINYYLLSPLSIISFFCPIFSGIFIGTEYSDGTMRNRLIVG